MVPTIPVRRRLPALLLVALAGCSMPDLLGTDDGGARFEARALGEGESLETPVVQARGGEGEVVVEARLSTPDPCRTLRATSRRSGSTLELEVTIRPPGESVMCAAVLGAFAYTARWEDLSPGTYQVVVSHVYPRTGWRSGRVFEGEARVR